MPPRTADAIAIADPIAAYSSVCFERSSRSGLPELVTYPKPPIANMVIATAPVTTTTTLVTLDINDSTLLTPATEVVV